MKVDNGRQHRHQTFSIKVSNVIKTTQEVKAAPADQLAKSDTSLPNVEKRLIPDSSSPIHTSTSYPVISARGGD